MRSSVNKVILVGTLGADPSAKHFESGGTICNFSIATDESYKNASTGNKVEKTEWHRIVAKDGLATLCIKYLRKGSKIYLEGRLQTREWEKDGIKRYVTEIVMAELTMLGSSQKQPHAAEKSPDTQSPDISPDPTPNEFANQSVEITPDSYFSGED